VNPSPERIEAIAQLLPQVMRGSLPESPVLQALVQIMARLLEPTRACLAQQEHYCDPRRAPEPFVALIARWLHLDPLMDVPDPGSPDWAWSLAAGNDCLRELSAEAMHLYHWRGTSTGLQRFLELCTGLRGFRIDEDVPDEHGHPRPAYIRIHAPTEARPMARLVGRVVASEKPAWVTAEVQYD
jgi:phage tail-like protein